MIIALIGGDYVRDTQIYVGKETGLDDVFAGENEDGWRDCSAEVFLGTFDNYSEARETVLKWYPNAAEEIFKFKQI